MAKVPSNFVTICNIVEWSTDKINQAWQDLSEKVTSEFIEWLVNEGNLAENQQKSLGVSLMEISDNKFAPGDTILGLIDPILNEDQKKTASDRYAKLSIENLETFYANLKETMTMEQKQVADSYIESLYARANN
ncbi:hypothetical protein HYU91_02475 [Candidatus Collierbacteria bacterium]|nr:hypothetical protein [Candidatus Collierbacteria bacterium]